MKDATQQVERSWYERVFVENFRLKLLALIFAIALFSVVHSDDDAQRSMFIDVVALLPPVTSDKVLVSTLPARIKVTLRGSRSRLSALEHDELGPIEMDLRSWAGSFYRFDPRSLVGPGQYRVVAVEPSRVALTWRPRAEATVPVRAKVRGMPEVDLALKAPISIAPARVVVSGPKEEIDAIHEVFTEEVALDGLGVGQYERRVRLEPLPGHLAFLEAQGVDVRFEIDVQRSERKFVGLEVGVVGAGEVALRPTTVQVTVRGPGRVLSGLSGDQLVPYVEPSASSPMGSVESLPVRLKGIPEACTLVRIEPDVVFAKRAR